MPADSPREDGAGSTPPPPSGAGAGAQAAGATPQQVATSRLFWVNLLLVAGVAPFATWWFKQHLDPYLTGILVVGGGLSLWAILRGVCELVQKLAKVDALSISQRLLGSPEVTLVLAVATAIFGWLWLTTNSLYFMYEAAGKDEGEFVIRVLRKSDGTPFMPDVSVGPAERVAGQAFFFRGEETELACRVIKPLRYAPLPCSIGRGEAKRVKVPAAFARKPAHLLRIVPNPSVYQELPEVRDPPIATYRLSIDTDGRTYRVDDFRRQSVLAGGMDDLLPLLVRQHDPLAYEQLLGATLRAAGIDAASSGRTAATLAVQVRQAPFFEAREKQRLVITLERIEKREGQEVATKIDGFPMEYEVTAEEVQTLWIPKQL